MSEVQVDQTGAGLPEMVIIQDPTKDNTSNLDQTPFLNNGKQPTVSILSKNPAEGDFELRIENEQKMTKESRENREPGGEGNRIGATDGTGVTNGISSEGSSRESSQGVAVTVLALWYTSEERHTSIILR